MRKLLFVGRLLILSVMVSACSKKSDTTGGQGSAPEKKESLSTEEAAKEVLKKYVEAPTCLDRLPFIMNPDKNKQAFRETYPKQDCLQSYESIDTVDCKTLDDGYCYPEVIWGKKKNALGGEYTDKSTYCVGKTPDGWKVDWRCSKGYNPVAAKTFQAQHTPRQPVIFRVQATIDDYYNFDFSNAKDTHYSVKMEIYGEQRDTVWLHGYIPKTSPDGQKLFSALKDGRTHPALIEVAYPLRSRSTGVVDITRLLNTGYREHSAEYTAEADLAKP